jgi:hypothetical protein
VAAWAVNQALRTQPRKQKALLEAGDALRAAQQKLLDGKGDAAASRSASEAERKAIGELVRVARGLAREGGFLSDAMLDRVRETLHAAATEDEARAEVESARVVREHRAAAFAGLEGFAAAPPAAPRRAAKKKQDAGADKRRAEEERKAAEREQRRAAQAELKEAKAAERDAARARREAEDAVNAAERDLAKARKAEAAAVKRREAAQRAL